MKALGKYLIQLAKRIHLVEIQFRRKDYSISPLWFSVWVLTNGWYWLVPFYIFLFSPVLYILDLAFFKPFAGSIGIPLFDPINFGEFILHSGGKVYNFVNQEYGLFLSSPIMLLGLYLFTAIITGCITTLALVVIIPIDVIRKVVELAK